MLWRVVRAEVRSGQAGQHRRRRPRRGLQRRFVPSHDHSLAKSIVKYNGENIKKPNILALDKDKKAILFCKDGLYYEYKFDPEKGEATETGTANIADLKAASE